MASLPTTSDSMRKMLLSFAIVGGGPTGIEFSAELHDIIKEDLSKLYPELIPYTQITVYDVAPKVLPMFDEKLGKYAMDRFSREGISIKTSHHVQELRQGFPKDMDQTVNDEHHIYTLKVAEEGELGIGMCVWSTGLMANPFLANGLEGRQALPEIPSPSSSEASSEAEMANAQQQETEKSQAMEDKNNFWKVKKHPKQGSIITNTKLQALLTPANSMEGVSPVVLDDVFALGDCATTEGTSWPATAQVANQKAEWLAKRLNKGDLKQVEGFGWKNMGVMAYLGSWNAIMQSDAGNVSGRAAWFIWRGAYLTKSVSLRNKILIPIYW
jgi:NADH dehydrogenase FAD-containing subunit